MKAQKIPITFICFLIFTAGYQNVDAQADLALQAYDILQQNCFDCHGEQGAFTEVITITYPILIENGTIIPGDPEGSELYRRLLETDPEKRMPLGQPPLSPEGIDLIRQWIQAGASDWSDTLEVGAPFITPQKMLDIIVEHATSLPPLDSPFARYFTLTHLYNADETDEALLAYQQALSKLVNSLSWGDEVINPQPIDPEATIFYIDLRDYRWQTGTNRWTQIEAKYPYKVEFNAPTQTSLRETLTILRQVLDCEVPFVHADWFLATASRPPLYYNILALPETDRELEAQLEVNVVENLQHAAGSRVWRAGFNDSEVSDHNRVVERHISPRYGGAYWKSYDFAGSVDTQNIFTHPLSFTHDRSEIIFNLPNGLQAYYLADADGNRVDEIPINIVANAAESVPIGADGNRLDEVPINVVATAAESIPPLRNGLSCIGCHTEGIKPFKDQVRAVVAQSTDPPYDKTKVLQLYVEKAKMDARVAEDIEHYRRAVEAISDPFGEVEPIQRSHAAFQAPLDAAHAAATVGLETEAFLESIRQNTGLQNLGLLVLENGTIKRHTWTSKFEEIVFALDFPEKSKTTPAAQRPGPIPRAPVYLPDPNLRPVFPQLFASLIPEKTALLANYPNPFNPETWIPYQLSEPGNVTLTIHSVNGTLVRTLALGQMPAGLYTSQRRAAYWDGTNDVGEPVASGIYFYTLTASDFTNTRKMLIKK